MKIESGDYSGEVTPVPIPNTVVKLLSADDTWWVTAWENRTSPVSIFFNIWLRGQAVKTPPFHGGNSSSILDGVTKKLLHHNGAAAFLFYICFTHSMVLHQELLQ